MTKMRTKNPCKSLYMPNDKTENNLLQSLDLEDKVQLKMYTELTGRFPKKSSHGHQYIMVLIKMDRNAILVAAMKNRSASKMICTYQELVDHL